MIELEVKVYSQTGLGFFVSYRDPFTKRYEKKRIGSKEDAKNLATNRRKCLFRIY
jgi:hypothetical protein